MYKNYLAIENFVFEICGDDEKVLSIGRFHGVIEGENPNLIVENAKKQLCEYFIGKRKFFDLPIENENDSFIGKVYEKLKLVKYGETISYSGLGEYFGANYSRAIGTAMSKNKLLIVLPCHRIIHKNGDLGNYSGGIELKKFLIDLESRYK